MHRQHHVTRRRFDFQHLDGAAGLREIDTGVRFGHQVPGAGGKLFDLETIIRTLPGSGAQEFERVAGVAYPASGRCRDQVNVLPLDVRLRIIARFQHRAGLGDQDDVRDAREHLVDVQVANRLRQVDPVLGQRDHRTRSLVGRVDFQEIVRPADPAIPRSERNAVADHPRFRSVDRAFDRQIENRSAVSGRGERYVAGRR